MKLLILLILSFNIVNAHKVERFSTPKYQFPENENQSGISRTSFERLINVFNQLYGNKLANQSIDWKRDVNWENPYIGAGSNQIEGNFYILFYGGLARAKFMTIGTVAAILCHEFGHKLGGLPRQQFPGEDEEHWSSSEGQADTFAAAICLPAVYDFLELRDPELLDFNFEDASETLCRFREDINRCRWVVTSGIDLIQTIQVYFDIDIAFASPAVEATEQPVRTLITAYPTYQCRMDIYKFNGADPAAPRRRCWYVD